MAHMLHLMGPPPGVYIEAPRRPQFLFFFFCVCVLRAAAALLSLFFLAFDDPLQEDYSTV